MNLDLEYIKKNIEALRKEISLYPSSELMAVVKTRTDEEIEYATSECGIDYIGDNHVQEFNGHIKFLPKAKIDMIGKLQTNKIKYLIGKVNLIQTLDSIHLAEEINKASQKKNIITNVLIEVNIASEEQKSGVLLNDFPALIEYASKLENITVSGLMTVSKLTSDSKEKRIYFSMLRKLRDEYLSYFRGYVNHPTLSMGMTDSYREALDEGSDIIRIGTGIFGPRKYTNV